ncbi:MAG: mechanosensitive ion channel [Chitinophagaceae bacterium]|nr:mechanosensitive ion channel [Chitinophagaceae bacterium]
MNDFLDTVWLGNPVRNYLAVLVTIVIVLVFKRYIARYVAGLLFRLLNRIWANLDKEAFKNLVAQPLGMFLLILVGIIALHKLRFSEELNIELYNYSLKRIIHVIGSVVLIIAFIWLLLRTIEFIAVILERKANLTPDQTDNQLVVFFRDFFKVIIFIIGILMVLKFAFGFDVGNMLTGLSIIGAAVALALRESLENLIASFIIFFDKPFTLGDLVKVQNITGNVEKIGLRSTRIRTDQKTYVTVPNKQMVDSILDNLSLRTQLKGELRLQVSLSTPSSKLQQLAEGIRILLRHPEIESANVVINDIAANAFIVNADYFTGPLTHQEYLSIRELINLQVLKLMEELDIEIAGASTGIRLEGQINGR